MKLSTGLTFAGIVGCAAALPPPFDHLPDPHAAPPAFGFIPSNSAGVTPTPTPSSSVPCSSSGIPTLTPTPLFKRQADAAYSAIPSSVTPSATPSGSAIPFVL